MSNRAATAVVIVLVPWLVFGQSGRTSRQRFRPGTPSVNVPAIHLGHVISPDRSAAVDVVVGEAEADELRLTAKGVAPVLERDVHGFLWVPREPATLVFATSGLYGAGRLWQWDRRHGLRKLAGGSHPSEEAFVLVGLQRKAKGWLVIFQSGKAESNYSRLPTRRVQLKG